MDPWRWWDLNNEQRTLNVLGRNLRGNEAVASSSRPSPPEWEKEPERRVEGTRDHQAGKTRGWLLLSPLNGERIEVRGRERYHPNR